VGHKEARPFAQRCSNFKTGVVVHMGFRGWKKKVRSYEIFEAHSGKGHGGQREKEAQHFG